jgi:hypothetical protein
LLLLVSRLLALLARLLLLLDLVRVELLGLAEPLALRRCESLVGVLRLNLALRREVALVLALVASIPAALSIAWKCISKSCQDKWGNAHLGCAGRIATLQTCQRDSHGITVR